jgi:hypothetical protein
MKFVSTEQVFDGLVNAAVIECAQKVFGVRLDWEGWGRDQRNMGYARGVQRVRMVTASRMVCQDGPSKPAEGAK